MIRAALLSFAMIWLGTPPLAACRLALVLAIDVSSSVSAEEHSLQRQGLAAALTDPAVAGAILSGSQPIALSIFEWSGRHQQALVQGWATIATQDDLAAVAGQVRRAARSFRDDPTAVGDALQFAAGLLDNGPRCDRRVVDVSGDGITNDGVRPQLVRRQPVFAGVVVNGLVIHGDDDRVAPYYRQEVLHGPGAFLEEAQGFAEFQAAMTRKLYRETQVLVIGTAPAPAASTDVTDTRAASPPPG